MIAHKQKMIIVFDDNRHNVGLKSIIFAKKYEILNYLLI